MNFIPLPSVARADQLSSWSQIFKILDPVWSQIFKILDPVWSQILIVLFFLGGGGGGGCNYFLFIFYRAWDILPLHFFVCVCFILNLN